MKLSAAIVVLALTPTNAWAQASASELDARVIGTVRAALTPALPYPASDAIGELPVDGAPTSAWMVRPTQDGGLNVEVLANPLNASNQTRAAKAMLQIQAAIEAAQRRSQISYDKAVADAQRTGRSQDVDGITLGDEGIAGARIDAEAHVSIDVAFNRPTYSYGINSSIEPASLPSPIAGAIAAISVPANIYRDGKDAATNERYCAAETHVFFGALTPPEVRKRSSVAFEISAANTAVATDATSVRGVVVSLRGNAQLIDQIVKLADWSRVRALITPN